ncbi:hypothetical protein [Archangium sp.]|uniref:hypothetical protein n=1 Tax=Archangium sp. TaxID=1872627 RepID=UPI002D4FB7D1|nr:hypothetical protein [Archangium sp.]HYO56274.1 hypothetical protein [Archangium sp.]
MSLVAKEDARGWIEIAEERIKLRQERLDAGTAKHLTWVGRSEWQMSLGRARFLHGDPLEQVHQAFRDAARGIETSFVMAYDEDSPLFLGRRAEPSAVSETTAINGLNAALMAADFELARRLARWIPPTPNDPSTSEETRHYVRGLKHLLLDAPAEARAHVGATLKRYEGKPPKSGYKRNYYTLAQALAGILEGDDERFNEGLRLQAEFYRGLAQGENADTAEEHICDHLVALGNLGLRHGRQVRGDIPFLPRGLLGTGPAPG